MDFSTRLRTTTVRGCHARYEGSDCCPSECSKTLVSVEHRNARRLTSAFAAVNKNNSHQASQKHLDFTIQGCNKPIRDTEGTVCTPYNHRGAHSITMHHWHLTSSRRDKNTRPRSAKAGMHWSTERAVAFTHVLPGGGNK